MRPLFASLSFGLALVVALPAFAIPNAAAAVPLLTVGPNVNVSHLPGNQSETTVAINPNDPSNVVIVSNMEGFNHALFRAFTKDGGVTWQSDVIATGRDIPLGCCDASLAFDEFGNLFLVYLVGKPPGGGSVGAKEIDLAVSRDGGATFRFVTRVDQTNTQASPLASGTVEDQPTVVTGGGTVWVTYKSIAESRPIIARGARVLGPVSGPGQVVFNPPEEAPGSGGGAQREGSFGDIAIGPNGQVMVVYQNDLKFNAKLPAMIFVNVDPDGLGPRGFAPAIPATTTNVNGFDFIPAQADRSVDAEASLVWDRTRGPNGRVYLVYTDSPTGDHNDTNIFVRFSDDAGKAWSAPVRVNDDTGRNSQFNPAIALDPTTGNVAVSWYDCRNDNGQGAGPGIAPGDTNGIPNDDAQVWGALSTDGGLTFSKNVQISAGTSNARDANNVVDFGDYSGLAFFNGSFFPAWADNSNSTGDNPDGALHQLDIYTAKVTVS